MIGDARFTAASSSADGCLNLNDSQVTLPMTGAAVLFADVWEIGGTAELVIGTVDASDIYTLSRWPDADSDGRPDPAGRVPLFSTSTGAYLTSIRAFGSAWLAFDRRCHDILILTDTDADGWPDAVGAIPFAMSNTYPKLLEVVDFDVLDDSTVRLGYTADPLQVFGGPHTQLSDSDADGVADQEVTYDEHVATVTITHRLEEGMTVLSVRAGPSAAGRVVQAHSVDAQGGEILRGSGTLALLAGSAEAHTDIALSPALILDEDVRVGLVGEHGDLRKQAIVEAVKPAFLRIEPARPVLGLVQSVTVHGTNLNQSYDLIVRGPDGVATEVTFTVISSTEITFTLPALGGDACAVSAYLFATEDGTGVQGDPVGESMRFGSLPPP